MKRQLTIMAVFLALVFGAFTGAQETSETAAQPATVIPVPSSLKKFMPSRHNAKLEEAKAGNIDLVMIGDSITHNWESQKNYASTFAEYNLLNLGFAGDRTQNVLWRIQNGALEGISPKLVTLMIGTNHAHKPKKGYTPDRPEDIFTGIQAIVAEVRMRLPGAKLIVFSVFPRRQGEENDRVNALNEMLPRIADGRHVFHADINKVFIDEKGLLNKELYNRDLLHLSPAGYAAWAKALLPILAKEGLPASRGKPNVVYILADDLGMGDLGCYGQKKLKTPNIDRLAAEGIKFTDHYSGNTVCSPSRAVLMTGQHPGHVHCRGNAGRAGESSMALDPAMTTLPRLFKNAGYATGAFGKWGLGITCEEGPANPMTHGFDHYSGWKSQMIAHTYYPRSIVRDGKEVPLQEGTFVHDLIMADAFDFVRRSVKDGKPFFCYIPTAVPHAAMHAPAELHEKWRKVYPQFDNKIGKYGAGPGESCPPVTNPIAGFAAMMENLDNQVGELLDLLKELGVDDNTLVIFCSDNGAHREGGHDPNFWDSNGPLRGIKRDLYDGGIRTPMLARWPGRIKPGSVTGHISAFWDVLPTAAELTGQAMPEQNDGISFLPTLLGKTDEQKQHEYLYWEHRANNSDKAVRMGKWKAVYYAKMNGKKRSSESKLQLFDLDKDIGEQNDVSAEHPEIMDRINKIMQEAHEPL